MLSLLIAIAAWLGVSIIIADNTSQSFEGIPVDIEMAMRGSTPESMHLTIIDAPQTTINVYMEQNRTAEPGDGFSGHAGSHRRNGAGGAERAH